MNYARLTLILSSVVLCAAATITCSAQDSASPVAGYDVPEAGTKIYEHAYRLLINVFVTDEGTLRVASRAPKSPTTDMVRIGRPDLRGILEPGDVITHVDRNRIDSLQSYYDAMNGSDGEVSLTIIDKNTGRPFDWVVKAEKVQVPLVPQDEAPPQNRVARVILIGLTNDQKIGPPISKSLEILRQLFMYEVDNERLDLQVVSGPECNARSIIERVREVGGRSNPGDSILVYYLGHGAYDDRFAEGDPSGGHFFQIPSEDLMRRTLFENMLAQPGQLKVLITDTCNVRALSMVPKKIVMEERTMTVAGPTKLEQLLLYHRGYLDVSASSRDQYSWFSFRFGGWFTLQCAQIMPEHHEWPSFLDQLSRDSNAFFLENKRSILENPAMIPGLTLGQIRDQKEMKPAIFRMSLDKQQAPVGGSQREIKRTVIRLVPDD